MSLSETQLRHIDRARVKHKLSDDSIESYVSKYGGVFEEAIIKYVNHEAKTGGWSEPSDIIVTARRFGVPESYVAMLLGRSLDDVEHNKAVDESSWPFEGEYKFYSPTTNRLYDEIYTFEPGDSPDRITLRSNSGEVWRDYYSVEEIREKIDSGRYVRII